MCVGNNFVTSSADSGELSKCEFTGSQYVVTKQRINATLVLVEDTGNTFCVKIASLGGPGKCAARQFAASGETMTTAV